MEVKDNNIETFYKVLGTELRRLRLERKLTLTEASKLLGCSFKTLQRYETGVNRIRMGTLGNLCKVYGVSYEEEIRNIQAAVDRLEGNVKTVTVKAKLIDPLVKEFETFTEEEKKMAIDYIKFMRGRNVPD